METKVVVVKIDKVIQESINLTVPSILEDCIVLRRLVWDVIYTLNGLICSPDSDNRIDILSWRNKDFTISVNKTDIPGGSGSFTLEIRKIVNFGASGLWTLELATHDSLTRVYYRLKHYEVALALEIKELGKEAKNRSEK